MTPPTSRSDIIVLRLVRSLRVVRVIRLATHIPGFDQILASCTYPARILINVFVLLAIGLYMFANLGVALFASVELEVRHNGVGLPQTLTFFTTSQAYLVYYSDVIQMRTSYV